MSSRIRLLMTPISDFDGFIRRHVGWSEKFVYLRTSPEKCMERIKKRSRNEETSVSMELLNSLHERYEDWLMKKSKFGVPAQVLVVDGNQSLEDMFQFYETNSQVILGISASKTD